MDLRTLHRRAHRNAQLAAWWLDRQDQLRHRITLAWALSQ